MGAKVILRHHVIAGGASFEPDVVAVLVDAAGDGLVFGGRIFRGRVRLRKRECAGDHQKQQELLHDCSLQDLSKSRKRFYSLCGEFVAIKREWGGDESVTK